MTANIMNYIGRKPAWHKLGIVTGEYLTWAEIEASAGLDFQVLKKQLFDENGKPVNAWGVFRADSGVCFGAVGEGYAPIQHGTGFQLIDDVVASQSGAHFETAGSLGRGEVVWGLADLALSTGIKGTQDEHDHFLLFSTAHDGSLAWRLSQTNVRVVCQNTLNMALKRTTQAQFRVKHTKNHGSRIAEAREILAKTKTEIMSFNEKLNLLATRKMTREAAESIFNRLFPKNQKGERPTRSQNALASVLANFESNDNNAIPEIRGSAYNMLNALTEYADHQRGTRNTGADDLDPRAKSAMFGSADKLKVTAFETIWNESQHLPQQHLPQPVMVEYKTPEPDMETEQNRLLSMVEIA